MSKKIPLTHNQFAIVDDEDFEEISKYNWYAIKKSNYDAYVAMTTIRQFPKKNVLMHRMIMGNQTTMDIDHINHDTLDNRKSNLRICTSRQNQCNRKRKNKTGFIGVCETRCKWEAYTWDKKTIHLGLFDTPELAARARDRYEIKRHGRENVDLNFDDS